VILVMSPVMSLVEIMAWAAVSFGIWLATLSSVTVPEMCFAAAAGLPCGVLAWAGRRALGASWRFRPSWALWPAPVALTAVIELAGLVRTAARSDTGRLKTIELPEEDPPLSAGREAAATLALCSTPGSQVAHFDPEEHTMIIHELLSLGPDLDSMVRR
jgi:hypothetical protein